MKNLHQNRHRSNRSNAYSGSKCSNWSRFDPYGAEFAMIRADHKPTMTFDIADDLCIDIYELPVRDSFIRPFTLEELESTLRAVPVRFLKGLERILLFGGTKKQELTANRLSRDGFYYPGKNLIGLHPFLRKELDYRCYRFSPHHFQEFRRAGVKIVHKKSNIYAQFTLESLKKYYLQIVLVHEIGHHVDFMHDSQSKLTEKFANWFACNGIKNQ